jgi:hypothetical protein
MDSRQCTLSISLDAEGEYRVTADPYPSAVEVRPYGRAWDLQALNGLLVDDLGLSQHFADEAIAEVRKSGKFIRNDFFPVDLRDRLQDVFQQQLRKWRKGER